MSWKRVRTSGNKTVVRGRWIDSPPTKLQIKEVIKELPRKLHLRSRNKNSVRIICLLEITKEWLQAWPSPKEMATILKLSPKKGTIRTLGTSYRKSLPPRSSDQTIKSHAKPNDHCYVEKTVIKKIPIIKANMVASLTLHIPIFHWLTQRIERPRLPFGQPPRSSSFDKGRHLKSQHGQAV